MIDPIAPRYVAITRDGTVPMRLLGVQQHRGTAQKHPKDPSVGMKDVFYGPNILLEAEDAEGLKEGDKVTLINWGNAVITSVSRCGAHTHTHVHMHQHMPNVCHCVHTQPFWSSSSASAGLPFLCPSPCRNPASGKVAGLEAQLALEDTNYRNTPKLTWMAADPPPEGEHTPTTLIHLDVLIKKAVLKPDDKWKEYINYDSKARWVQFFLFRCCIQCSMGGGVHSVWYEVLVVWSKLKLLLVC